MKVPVAGIYISWPFCAQKCTYCNFASGVLPRELEDRYLAAVSKEISSHVWQWTPDTVYLGGGTPSAMATDHLDRLLKGLPGGAWREATIEAAPGTPAPIAERIGDAWLRAGINRVSLGVQSFIRRELARTGRSNIPRRLSRRMSHCCVRVESAISISISLQAFRANRKQAGPNLWLHPSVLILRTFSVYMLEVDDDSRLGGKPKFCWAASATGRERCAF